METRSTADNKTIYIVKELNDFVDDIFVDVKAFTSREERDAWYAEAIIEQEDWMRDYYSLDSDPDCDLTNPDSYEEKYQFIYNNDKNFMYFEDKNRSSKIFIEKQDIELW